VCSVSSAATVRHPPAMARTVVGCAEIAGRVLSLQVADDRRRPLGRADPRCHRHDAVEVECGDASASNYPVFKGPATLYVLKTMPDGMAFVLTRASSRGSTLSEKKRLPRPSKTG
jgi:hypothetical protein